ncbi:hypothetical protein GDO86_012207 [Hymenochirus boettgeri]|uniref:Uncharacterized protein n=1 Tax=Hymenochirus boettgeri TaxID=247094 RepID=A0A8T2IUC4_9PIPI|nr:hypothetical protein GDO86_012207 [Hymenochirus boettgeri]
MPITDVFYKGQNCIRVIEKSSAVSSVSYLSIHTHNSADLCTQSKAMCIQNLLEYQHCGIQHRMEFYGHIENISAHTHTQLFSIKENLDC